MASANSLGRHALLSEGALAASTPSNESELATAPGAATELDLRALFELHYGSVWRLLRRLGVAHAQLDDAAQEVFWVVARRLRDIQAGSEHAFVYGVALRVASNLLRRQHATPAMTDLDAHAEIADRGLGPEIQMQERQARQLLDVVLAQLPLELRSVFVLFELEGMPVKDIAALENLPLGTASSRLRRAREEFSAIAKRVRAQRTRRGAKV